MPIMFVWGIWGFSESKFGGFGRQDEPYLQCWLSIIAMGQCRVYSTVTAHWHAVLVDYNVCEAASSFFNFTRRRRGVQARIHMNSNSSRYKSKSGALCSADN